MKILKLVSPTSGYLLVLALSLLLFSYIARAVGIYYFWESDFLGWIAFWIAVVFLLRDLIRYRRQIKKNTMLFKIGMGVCFLVLMVMTVLAITIPNTDACKAGVAYIKQDPGIRAEVGDISQVVPVPFGSLQMSSNHNGTTGQAELSFIIKGQKKYKDITLALVKESGSDWQVYASTQ